MPYKKASKSELPEIAAVGSETGSKNGFQTRLDLQRNSKSSVGTPRHEANSHEDDELRDDVEKLGSGRIGQSMNSMNDFEDRETHFQKKAQTLYWDETPIHQPKLNQRSASVMNFKVSPRAGKTRTKHSSVSGFASRKFTEEKEKQNLETEANDLLEVVEGGEFWLKHPEETNRFPVPVMFEVDNFELATLETQGNEIVLRNSNTPSTVNLEKDINSQKRSLPMNSQETERESNVQNSQSGSESSSVE